MSRKQDILRLIKFYKKKTRKAKQELPAYLEMSIIPYIEHLLYIDSLQNYVDFLITIKNEKEEH